MTTTPSADTCDQSKQDDLAIAMSLPSEALIEALRRRGRFAVVDGNSAVPMANVRMGYPLESQIAVAMSAMTSQIIARFPIKNWIAAMSDNGKRGTNSIGIVVKEPDVSKSPHDEYMQNRVVTARFTVLLAEDR